MKLVKNVFSILAIIVFLLLLNSTSIFAKTVIVDTDTLKLRKEASTDSTILELLNNGQELEYIEETEEWYKVKVSGMTGFVHKDYAKLKEEINEKQNNVEENEQNIIKETNTNAIDDTIGNIEQDNMVDNNIEESYSSKGNIQIETNEELKINKDCNGYILPLINSNIIEELKKGDIVTVIAKTNNWLYVEGKETNTWIRLENIMDTIDSTENNKEDDVKDNSNENAQIPEDTNDEETEIKEKTMYVNTSSIYVRKGPGTDYEIIDSLILNSGVTVIAENGEWYKVKIQGETGYIAKRLLSSSSTQTTSRGDSVRENVTEVLNNISLSKGEQAVEYAKKYLGCKYVYGASGPGSFDCSGFTMFVFKEFGITLSHSATAQSKVGNYVAKEDLQVGDLVFFTDYETGNGIGHCGIYVGEGNFIHASSGTGYCVKISTLTSGSYFNRYETARRVL